MRQRYIISHWLATCTKWSLDYHGYMVSRYSIDIIDLPMYLIHCYWRNHVTTMVLVNWLKRMGKINRGPFHERFFHHNSNSMENWFQYNSIVGYHIATEFLHMAWQHSCHFTTTWMREEWNFHEIWNFELWWKNCSWNRPQYSTTEQ